jgi:N-acetylglucosamine-6-sulfatase
MPPAKLSAQAIAHIDEIYHKRWETLLAVDEMVEGIVSSLGRRNLLDNTFVVFTSDNGYHMGQFAQAFDKRQPYDTDIRVPLLVAGPSVPAKSLVHAPVALIDLAPTILEWTGISTNDQFDGESFATFLNSAAEMPERQILIEYWGEGNERTHSPQCPWSAKDRLNQCTADADCHCQDSWNNTYSCVRHLAADQNLLYCEFRDEVQFVEAYDLAGDLHQMTNLGFDMLPSVRAHYSLAVDHLAKCSGDSCRQVF